LEKLAALELLAVDSFAAQSYFVSTLPGEGVGSDSSLAKYMHVFAAVLRWWRWWHH
jgi:hypothetical protein